MSFLNSKKYGDMAEIEVLNILKNKGLDCKLNTDKSLKYDYDIISNNPTITFEVKMDLYATKSGNLCIEFFNSKKNRPSGIMITKANYWIHVLIENENIVPYIIKVCELKNFINTILPHKTITNGGDKNADLFLYKKEDILPRFTLLSEFDLKEI